MEIVKTGRYEVTEDCLVAGSWDWKELKKGDILNVVDVFPSVMLIRVYSPGLVMGILSHSIPATLCKD